jgi:hypothetical protein
VSNPSPVADGIQIWHQMAKLQITIKGLVNELYLDDLGDKRPSGRPRRFDAESR